ncbi:outer membrane protein assembly factor BamA [Cognatishimia activa]|uniref:Outer membrane protein assembly factor BamA n=1 Tax=Cognatishimia activa TaxID=1715691 RepID=A0A975EPF7_9RHOB|nr:outer membrane protein assembly factor BamA [Cognatishimia activa]QTN35805.1 outer membrane protein assembly factor BamA [Cognatishimia activa]
MSSNFRGKAPSNAVELSKPRHLLFAISLLISMLFVLLPAVSNAQSFNLNAISVEGNNRIDDSAVIGYAGIAPGQVLSGGDLNEAYQNILASGLFESVEFTPRGNTLVISVVEYPTINIISFEGNRRLKDDALSQAISSQSRRVFNPSTAERDAVAIAEAYAAQGRIAARVTPRIIRRSDNRVDLVFEIFEGSLAEIERLGFVGNRQFSDRRLRRVLATKQAGILRQFFRSDTLVEDRIEFDKQVLRDFYQSRGYVDFRVTGVNAELASERDGYFITFNVEEGQQFTFGEITTVSNIDDADAEEYQDTLRIRPGVVYSPSLVESSIARLERLANRQGLDFVRIEPRISRNDRDLSLDVEFVVDRGPRIFIERIDIEGNTTTLDRVVRQQFNVVEGDPFNPREIRESAERIRALGFFANSEVNAREGSRPDQVIVDVDVEEQNTGSLSFGGTYSTDSGFGLVAGFKERNFLGRGQELAVDISTSPDVNNYQLSFTEPRFLGRNVAVGFALAYQDVSIADARYTNTVGSFKPFVGFQLGERSTMQLRYSYENVEMTVPTASLIAGSVIDSEAAVGTQLGSGIGYTYQYDSRVGGLNPDAGVLFELSQDFYGLGGDIEYLKTTAKTIAQRKILQGEVTLRATLEGGAIIAPNNDTRVHNRFALSSSQIRGFEPLGIGPRDQVGAADDGLGGKYYAVARFDAEFPIGLPEEYGISGGLFYDIGSLWDTDGSLTNVVGNDFSLRQTVGVSLFWDTPIGPLRFNFSKALQKEAFDKEQTFNLTLRTEF